VDENARYMLAIAEAGSISEAARRAHVSQPALSQRLKQLETHLGCELFDRQTSPLAPTPAGTTYLEWARRATAAEETMERQVAAIANRERRYLAIGTSLPRGNGILPDVLERFYREVSGCTVSVEDAGIPDAHNQLLLGSKISCALLTPVRPESSFATGEVLCTERMVLAVPLGMELASFDGGGVYPSVLPQDIAGLPFIMPPRRFRHHRFVRNMMDSANVRLNVVLHSGSNEMTSAAVARGIGASILPTTSACSWDHATCRFYEIDGLSCPGDLYYNRLLGTVAGSDELALVSMLRDWIAGHPELAAAT
jgi:DNA-binding transcriptional LysR family regulator